MKKLIWGVIMLIIIASCSKSNDVYPSLKLGNQYLGGTIFYILQVNDPYYITGETHGFIVSNNDEKGEYTWGCSGINPSDLSLVLGDGDKNINIIKQDCHNTTMASICNNGWYVPNNTEMGILIANQQYIKNIGDELYWTSNCLYYSPNQGVARNFLDASTSYPLISDSLYVRLIKKF